MWDGGVSMCARLGCPGVYVGGGKVGIGVHAGLGLQPEGHGLVIHLVHWPGIAW